MVYFGCFVLLIVLIGGGKMFVGFFLILVDLVELLKKKLGEIVIWFYIFYIFLFKVLVVDVVCNVEMLVFEMNLVLSVEMWMGDMFSYKW